MGNNCFAQWTGSGTAIDPWQISTKAHLITLATNVNNGTTYSGKYFKMTANINMTGGSFTPIGRVTLNGWGDINQIYSFQGNFNGDGKIISNLTINSGIYIGLFGYLSNATIENIGIDNTCSFTCPSHGGWPIYYGGTLAAYSDNSNFYNCYSSAQIIGNGDWWGIGGFIGGSNQDTINNCYSRAKILRSTTADFTSSYYGGLIGQIINTSNFYLSNSYSAPDTIPRGQSPGPNGNVGALIGNNFTYTTNQVNNTYYLLKQYYYAPWNTNIDYMNSHIGIPKSSIDMQTMQFAIDLNACQTNIWRGFTNNYPVLYWQGTGTALPRCLDGSGTEADPFRIRCVADLVTLSTNVSNGTNYSTKFLLVENDINFYPSGQTDSSSSFNPIGNNTNAFQGNFNGNGKVISNLTINSGKYVGLFGYISNNATISSLGIEGFNITADEDGWGGGLIGFAAGSSTIRPIINSCYSISIVKGNKKSKVGGLIGYATYLTINNCYSRSHIEKTAGNGGGNNNYFGGLVGQLDNCTMLNCYSAPTFFSATNNFGLLVGGASNSTITNSYYCDSLSANGYNSIGSAKSISKMKTGCFPTYLNNSQSPVVWFKAKRQVNWGYPVLSWQKLSDGITPAGFEGNCLGYDTTFVGSQTTQYKVQYVKDLIYISNMVANDTTYSSKYFQMLNDINYNNGVIDSSSLYNPIGTYTSVSNNKPFSGNFNGLRNAIANYSFSDTTKNNIGFFGYTNLATIQRLGISNINICAKDTVGGLVANADSTKIGGCFVYGYKTVAR
jgi:hypothetical protein